MSKDIFLHMSKVFNCLVRKITPALVGLRVF
jgi:hypothetical protein